MSSYDRLSSVTSKRVPGGVVHNLPVDGWEYYLDQLVAAREGASLPKFDTYYPAQKDHYTALDA